MGGRFAALVCACLVSGLEAVQSLAPEELTFEVAKDRLQREQRELKAEQHIEAEDPPAKTTANVSQTVEDLRLATRTVRSQAAAAAEEAKGAERNVEEMVMQQKVLLAKAKDYSAQQEAEVKYAEESNEEMEKEFEKAKEFSKTADAKAKELAKASVQQMFLAKNKELESWRDEVLTDHWALGRREASKAAQVYQVATGQALEKANSYSSSAQTLATVAKGLAKEANQATLTAAEKRMAGDVGGALRLSEAAGVMRSHGRKLAGYAKDLQQEAQQLSDAAPGYLSSGQQAAARAEWEANPQALPPMTLDPTVAYVPA